MADRGYDRTPALAHVRTIRANALRMLPYIRRSSDPDRDEMIALLEEIVIRTEKWKKKTAKTHRKL